MARTSSQSLYYWQADVGMFDDPKLVDLNDAYGPLGECIFMRILDYIARTDGYFAQINDALIVYIYRSVGSKWIKSKHVVSEVIQFCGVCGLFDVNLLTQNVITSRGIQRRWLHAKKKARARGYSAHLYWLLEDEKPAEGRVYDFSNNCNNNADNCSNNSGNCNNNAHIRQDKTNTPLTPQRLGGKVKKNGAKNEREEWYRQKREKNFEVVKYWTERANRIPEYKELYQSLKATEIKVAKQEINGEAADTEKLDEIKAKISTLLSENGIRKEDLVPRYTCSKCKDTGFLDNGSLCDCYRGEE